VPPNRPHGDPVASILHGESSSTTNICAVVVFVAVVTVHHGRSVVLRGGLNRRNGVLAGLTMAPNMQRHHW
jgi:hypothetical protein